jgi:hypothetical protein
MIMASRAPAYEAAPLDLLLASVPSLPRAILARLTARMIERLDELDGDTDLESEVDCCAAGDDMICGGLSPGRLQEYGAPHLGSDDDAEPMHVSAFDRDQTRRPQARYNQPQRRRKSSAPMVSNVSEFIPIGRWKQAIG